MAEDEHGAGGQQEPQHRDWTKGSIVGNLWSLAWPMTVSSSIMTLGPFIDAIWIGKLGSVSMAGVTVSGTVVMLINSLIMGLFTGLRAMVARFVGAGDEKQANHVSQQAFVVGVLLSLVMAAIGLFFAESILRLWNLEPEVVAAGAAYMRIELIGMFTMSFGMLAQSIMHASGDARTPMKISIGVRLFHILLCPFLIFGWWVFPELGVRGAALSSVISQGIGGAIGLWVLFTGRTRLRLSLRNFSFDGSTIWRMVKIGIPASLGGIHMNVGNIVFMWFIAPFGTLAIAGHMLVSRVDMLILMPAMGLGAAAGVLAAQNLGAMQPGRAEKTAWTAVGLFTALMFVFSIIVLIWAGYIVLLFNAEPDLIDLAGKFLKIQTVSYMCNGLMMVMMNVMNSVGDTLIAFIIDLVTMWGIRVPLAVLLPRVANLGVYGIRWALVADTVSSAIIFIIYFKSGRWKRKKI
ncbi:MAG: MATE family efflux transporter [Dehalococcoidales bacterium]|nr:MATE family efflux transporter [Dehalococcoidales bacterium]